jgi:hypothetical protein
VNNSPFGVAVRYDLWQLGQPGRRIDGTILWDRADIPKVAHWAMRGDADYLLIQDAEGPMDDVTDGLGLPRLNHELALFQWHGGRWTKLRSWPVPSSIFPDEQKDSASIASPRAFLPRRQAGRIWRPASWERQQSLADARFSPARWRAAPS